MHCKITTPKKSDCLTSTFAFYDSMHSDAASNFCINAFTLLFFFDWQCRHHHQSFVSVKFNYLDLCWLIELAERAVYPLHSTYLFKLFACCATFFQWKWIATGASVWKSTEKKSIFSTDFPSIQMVTILCLLLSETNRIEKWTLRQLFSTNGSERFIVCNLS